MGQISKRITIIKTKKIKEYINFVEIPRTTKTKFFHIVAKSDGTVLGHISWYFPWRQYCSRRYEKTIWSSGCDRQIIEFEENLNKQHKIRSVE